MKTFLLNIPTEIRNWSNTLDVMSVLCSKSWNVFNDEGVKEVYIFQKDGTLIASHNGKVTKAKWEYLVQNSSLIIENLSAEAYMLRPAYYDDKVLALKVDGTKKYALMVAEKYVQQLMLESIEKVQLYITDKKQIEAIWEQDKLNAQKRKDEQEMNKRLYLQQKAKEWEKFIDGKVEEKLKSPEVIDHNEKLKQRKKKYITIFSIIAIMGSILYLAFYNELSLFLIAIGICGAFATYMITGNDSISEIAAEDEMKSKYPFDKFLQANQ